GAHKVVQMHDAHQFLTLVDHRHCHDPVLHHAIKYRARELTGASELGVSRHDAAHRHGEQIVAAVLDETAQVPSSQYPVDARSCVDEDRDAAALRNHDDCLPHG